MCGSHQPHSAACIRSLSITLENGQLLSSAVHVNAATLRDPTRPLLTALRTFSAIPIRSLAMAPRYILYCTVCGDCLTGWSSANLRTFSSIPVSNRFECVAGLGLLLSVCNRVSAALHLRAQKNPWASAT